MGRYQKKPVKVEAFRWTGDEHQTEDPVWMGDAIRDGKVRFWGKGPELVMEIEDDGHVMRANPGDWVIRGIKGEIYPCRHEIFVFSYEAAE